MKLSEIRNTIKEEIQKALKESYYNPAWKLTSIQSWIQGYADKNKLPFKLLKKVNKQDLGSKITYYVYDIGDIYGLILKDTKVAGAPRLSGIDVIVGTKGSTLGSLSKALTQSESEGDEKALYDLLDKVIAPKQL
jgi:hypothetical protein